MKPPCVVCNEDNTRIYVICTECTRKNKELWEFCERTAREVDKWPAWKREGWAVLDKREGE